MVWTIIKPETKRPNKDTRWDRIRKKVTNNNYNVKNTFVKKFVEMDFIGKNNTKIMNGDNDVPQRLDPALVMNLRHAMKKRKTSSSVKRYKANIDKCIVHNLEVEERHIHNELTKFRSQLQRNRLKCKIKRPIPSDDNFTLSNKNILRSLENTQRHIKDFYEAPMDAIRQFKSHTTGDQGTELISTQSNKETHSVHFNESVGVVKYNQRVEEPDRSWIEDEQLDNRAKFYNSKDERLYEEQETSSIDEPQFPQIEVNPKVKAVDDITDDMDQNVFDSSDAFCTTISNLAREALNEINVENLLDSNIQIEGTSLRTQVNSPLIVTKMLPNRSADTEAPSETPSISVDDDDTSASNEQNVVIEQLFQRKEPSNEEFLKTYFFKWVYFVTIQKFERQSVVNKIDRVSKINAFLAHIRREKRKQASDQVTKLSGETTAKTAIIAKRFQNKIKIQQDIIDLQKVKLQRQERLITELKLNKLCEEAKEDRKEVKAELKNALRNVDSKSRDKVRCLQIMGNLHDSEDENTFARLQGRSIEPTEFLTNMQERALERSLKHELAKQRRLQHEAEREAAKLAMEEAKRLEDEKAKRLRIEFLKEKRRQEKLEKIAKERERLAMIEKTAKAEQFYRIKHLRKSMTAFKKLIEHKKRMHAEVQRLRKRLIVKNAFNIWKRIYLLTQERKLNLAIHTHRIIAERRAFRAWTLFIKGERSKFFVAVDWHEFKLNQAVLSRWRVETKVQKIVEDKNMKKAAMHYEWHLKWKIVEHWQRLPQILRQEKETDERRQRWRLKIWELLPDYKPNRDEFYF